IVPRRDRSKVNDPWAVETWIEREQADGSVEKVTFTQETGLVTSFALRCGWYAMLGPDQRAVLVPADARSVEDCLPFSTRAQNPGGGGVDNDALRQRIDARRFVYRQMGKKPADPRSWHVVDVVSKTDDPAVGLEGDDEMLALDGQI